MNRDKAIKWAEALESGEYEQGVGNLRRLDDGAPRYCCLGVLSDLYIKETGAASWDETGAESVCYITNGFAREPGSVIAEVAIWAGFGGDTYPPNPSIGNRSAMGMNDTLRYDFKRIAHEIRKAFAPDTVAA